MVSVELTQRLDNKWNPGPTVVQWVHVQHPMLISLVSLGNYRMCPWTHGLAWGKDSTYYLASVSTLFCQQQHDDILGTMVSMSGQTTV